MSELVDDRDLQAALEVANIIGSKLTAATVHVDEGGNILLHVPGATQDGDNPVPFIVFSSEFEAAEPIEEAA